ncbi:MAG: helix-turn-helix domain-containing protein [Archangium sp.]|nr:helix-turn-helix domain-containing protein [Archangium sp.]
MREPRKPGISHHAPSAHLRSRVAAIQLVVSDGTPVSVLPSSSSVLGFQYSGRIRAEEGLLSTAGVTGLQRGPRRYRYLGETASVLVRFTPLGSTCLGAPADELADKSVPLEGLLSPLLVRQTTERLLEAPDERSRVEVIERLLARLPWEPDALVAHALELLEHMPVARIARELGLSERQLERRFRARVGISPRAFASLRRFERAVALSKHTASLTELALEAGYYDQSHFNRDFRRFAGTSPTHSLVVSDSYKSRAR